MEDLNTGKTDLEELIPEEERERFQKFLQSLKEYGRDWVSLQERGNWYWNGMKVKLGASTEGVYALVPVSSSRILVISKQWYKGNEYMDFRIFQKGIDTGTSEMVYYPTKQGFKLNPTSVSIFWLALYYFLNPSDFFEEEDVDEDDYLIADKE